MHQHGSTYPAPRTKAELVRHLRVAHGESEQRIDPRRWTVAALKDEHDVLHADKRTG